ncbi:hypothetical protein T35B1_18828 [Salinisphaera shabanensis T35B1]
MVYWITYALPALLALARLKTGRLGWFCLGSALTVIIGLRFRVGTDWANYVNLFYLPAGNSTLLEAITRRDPAFFLLNWLASHAGLGVWFVNLSVGAIFVSGLVYFVRRLPEPILAFTAAIPYAGIVVAMNYSRQAAAIGLLLFAFAHLCHRRFIKFSVFVVLASLFHQTAIVLLGLAAFVQTRNKFFSVITATALGGAAAAIVLAERIGSLWALYVVSDYSQKSDGAIPRVAMNFLPAAVFLLLQRRLALAPAEKTLWTAISVASVIAMGLVFIAPTAVDRAALYFTPIQFVVAAYVMQLFKSQDRTLGRLVIICVYGFVMFVWLTYASNASYWLPYRFWPLFEPGRLY